MIILNFFEHFIYFCLETLGRILLNFHVHILLIQVIFTFCSIVCSIDDDSNSSFISRDDSNASVIFQLFQSLLFILSQIRFSGKIINSRCNSLFKTIFLYLWNIFDLVYSFINSSYEGQNILLSVLDGKIKSFTQEFFFLFGKFFTRNIPNPFSFMNSTMLLLVKLLKFSIQLFFLLISNSVHVVLSYLFKLIKQIQYLISEKRAKFIYFRNLFLYSEMIILNKTFEVLFTSSFSSRIPRSFSSFSVSSLLETFLTHSAW